MKSLQNLLVSRDFRRILSRFGPISTPKWPRRTSKKHSGDSESSTGGPEGPPNRFWRPKWCSAAPEREAGNQANLAKSVVGLIKMKVAGQAAGFPQVLHPGPPPDPPPKTIRTVCAPQPPPSILVFSTLVDPTLDNRCSNSRLGLVTPTPRPRCSRGRRTDWPAPTAADPEKHKNFRAKKSVHGCRIVSFSKITENPQGHSEEKIGSGTSKKTSESR